VTAQRDAYLARLKQLRDANNTMAKQLDRMQMQAVEAINRRSPPPGVAVTP
jgi:hypothetical protein